MKTVFQQALMRRRIVRLHKSLMGLFKLGRCRRQGELVIVQTPLDVEVRFVRSVG